jgi:hypothetical protein
MKIHQILDHYFVFKRIGHDCCGTNFRVGLLEGKKPSCHKLVTEIHPYIYNDTSVRDQAFAILETVGKLGIPNLFAPERVIREENQGYLVFPYIEGKTLDKVLEDADKNGIAVPFSLAFQLILAIANIIKMGTSIQLKGSPFFHGFLTPDHIIVGNNGKLYLKYYGLWPFITQKEELCAKVISQYGSWLAPEFIKQEEVVPQADIYYLGYLVYRMLTGKYFTYLPGEDFDTTITNISFSSDIPLTDKNFLINIIEFFRKTLNPDIRKRFSGSEELKSFIEQNFKIKDTGLVSPDLASFMFSIYKDEIEESKKELQQELAAPIPERKGGQPGETVVSTTILEESPGSKLKYVGLVALIIVLIGVGTFLYLNRISQEEQRQIEGMEQKIVLLEQRYQQQIETLRTTYEKKLQHDSQNKDVHLQERDKLIREIEDQKKREIDSIRNQLQKKKNRPTKKETTSTKPTPQKKTIPIDTSKGPTEKTKQEIKTTPDDSQPKDVIKPVDVQPKIVPLARVSQKPGKISGKDPVFSVDIARNYQGKRATVKAMLLIDQKGIVEKVKLLNTPKLPKDLEEAVVTALRQWTYTPARKDGETVKVWFPETIKFSIGRTTVSEPVKKSTSQEDPASKQKPAKEIYTLNEVGTPPVKISGKAPSFPRALRITYAGRRATVHSELLINESGIVQDVKASDNIPEEIKSEIVKNYMTWTYKPAVRENKAVKVWIPVTLKISFKR